MATAGSRYRTQASLIAQAAVLAAGMALIAQPARAQPQTAERCLADVVSGKGREIVCSVPLRMSEKERAELEATTRGYFKDARCTVSIRIERALIDAAVADLDHVFTAPPQPVACQVTAVLKDKDGPRQFPVEATFAPRVVIKDGRAVEATPGLAGTSGVSRALAWPVETWVNKGATVREGMLEAINPWLEHMRKRRQAAR